MKRLIKTPINKTKIIKMDKRNNRVNRTTELMVYLI